MSLKGLFPEVSNFVNRELGINSDLRERSGFSINESPWSDVGDDVFFPTSKIDGSKWNKVFPYRLVVVDVSKGNNPIVSGLRGSTSQVSTNFFENGSDYVISQTPVSNNWVFELPITPQQIQIVDQYAINTIATARGVLEEHNGVKFKNIAISATTGIWALRPSTGSGITASSSLGSIFGGSLQALQNVNVSAGRIKSAFTGSKLGSSQSSVPARSMETGYYQALFLSNFLERYTQEKKKPENKGWRLVLDIPKMNVSYVVTPVNFALQKSAQSPNEFLFNLQLKAWKRITIAQAEPVEKQVEFKIKPSDFQRVLNTIRETRRTLSNTTKLLRAVRSDFQAPLEALRQTALAVKGLAGVAYTAADLPGQIVSDYSNSITESFKTINKSFVRGADQRGNGTVVRISSSSLKTETQQEKSAFIASASVAQNIAYEGLSLDQVTSGDLGAEASSSVELNPMNALFKNPEEFFDVLDSMTLDSINLSPDQQDRIQDQIDLASLVNIDDLNQFKATLLDTALLISNNFGAGAEVYSSVYGRPAPRKRAVPLTLEENEILASIYEAIEAYDILTASRFFDNLKTVNAMEYVGGLANEAEIDFDQTEGKILVPVPFGLTIEQIAARYLQDANKWLEIVTINKLRAPYIDEEGFVYEFLSNGNGRQINVNDNEKNIFIGQILTLYSNSIPPFRRKVLNIERISDNNYLVTLDGEDNLDSLTIASNAKIKGYKPGTVNSQNQIFIPTNEPVEDDDLVNTPKAFDSDRLTKISKVDWLLDENGDLAINDAGEIQLSAGLTNLIQALKLKIKTKKGSLLQHLDYGLGLEHGISVADIESGKLVESLTKMIEDDPRFSGIERLNIRISGNTIFVDLAVKIASGSGVLPVTFEI
jgi:hypothetical protein